MADNIVTKLSGVHLLGVVSDTHGHVENTLRAVRILESLGVDAVLHCGDIGATDIPSFFQAWPTHYVLGNVDWPGPMQAAIEAVGGVCHGRFGCLDAGGHRVAFLHGDDVSRLAQETESGVWDLVCHGHTHRAQYYYSGHTLVVNPGALQRTRSPSLAVVELGPVRGTIIPLD